MVKVGQLRMWRKREDGGQFLNIDEGTLCLVTQCFDNGTDSDGETPRTRTFTVLQDGETPWFLESELEEHTIVLEKQEGDYRGN